MEDLIKKIETNSIYFALISLVFGVMFTTTFYQADIGIMYTSLVAIVISLSILILKKLKQPIKKSTYLYFTGIMLLGLASFITANTFLQFFNTIGIMLLFCICLLQQFHDDSKWGFVKYIQNLFMLAINIIVSIDLPFRNTFKNTKLSQNRKARSISIGLCIAIPFLIIIISLLSGADMIFENITVNVFSNIFSPDIFPIGFLLILGFVGCYCVICGTCRIKINDTTADWEKNKKDPMIAITFMGCITVTYLLFCVIQFIFLFAGGSLGLPDGVTYSEYAREGFFELVFVTMLNFVIVIACQQIFEQNKILKSILLLMSGCTYIMITSAIYRMFLYVGSYHLSFLRVLVLWFLGLNILLITGAVILIMKPSFNLFRYCLIIVSTGYILLAFSRPDTFIATYNIQNTAEFTKAEVDYLLYDLSYDAAPYIMELTKKSDQFKEKEKMIAAIEQYKKEANKIQNERTWREFNLSYYWAGSQ